jgi:chemotaxis protein methyltransferase CheR
VRFGDATLFRKQQQIARIIPLRTPPDHDHWKTQHTRDEEAREQSDGFASILPFRSGGSTTPDRSERGAAPIRSTSPEKVTVGKPDIATRSTPATDLEHGVDCSKPEQGREEELIHIARTLADQGLMEDACSAARLAVEAAKMNPQAHFMYATILREMGETSESIKEFHRALYLDNGFVPAHFALGSLYQHLGDTPRGHRHLRNAYDLLQNSREGVVYSDTSEMSPRRMLEIVRSMLGEA